MNQSQNQKQEFSSKRNLKGFPQPLPSAYVQSDKLYHNKNSNDLNQNYYHQSESFPIVNTAPPLDSRHSRSHSHNIVNPNPLPKIFYPLNHNGHQQNRTIGSPIPSSAPPQSPSSHLKQQQQQQQGSPALYHFQQSQHHQHQRQTPLQSQQLQSQAKTQNQRQQKSQPQQPQQQLQPQQPQQRQPQNWTSLIPPQPSTQDEFHFTTTKDASKDPSQRHSIAISPSPDNRDITMNDEISREPIEYIPPKKKSRKTCKKCGLEITGQFVRALQNAYHVNCFNCHECGKQCSAKFFPSEIVENGKPKQIALCEYDYFKKLNLICFSCNNALRGPYVTALGNKYHLEHFKCSVCQHVFDSDESYYEHGNDIFCHYHFSKLYASHCEGCQSSIVKQFVELFRGGRNQHWHPECFMVHKFWNVCITADSVGLQKMYNLQSDIDLRLIKMSDIIDSNKLIAMEQHIEQVVMNCWLMLSGYEQATASCISDMLLNACTGNKYGGLVITGKLILNIEILFNALDYVLDNCKKCQQSSLINGNDQEQQNYFQIIKKEPRNITGKIMSYLAILRKSGSISKSGTLSAELLSVITGCAHYLKLLIRIGLYNALKLNKIQGTTEALETFLQLISKFESINTLDIEDLKTGLYTPQSSTDACTSCAKSIEKSCMKFGDHRWHLKCFICNECHSPIESVEGVTFNVSHQAINCKKCINEGIAGFEYVSDLSQLVYLLKIALLRSRSVMNIDFSISSTDDKQSSEQDNYVKTLDDVTRLRSRRQSQKLSKSVKKKARKSIIVTAPEADQGDVLVDDVTSGITDMKMERKVSEYSFDNNEEISVKKELQIRDEPLRQLTSIHLDRTSDLLKNEKSLTLDDIPRIVAAEQARDQRPNAFKHHNRLYQRSGSHKLKNGGNSNSPLTNGNTSPSSALNHILNSGNQTISSTSKQKFVSELNKKEHFIIRHLAIEALNQINSDKFNKDELLTLIQTKKSPTFWEKLRFGGGGNSSGNQQKTNGVFGVDLSILTKKFGVESDLGVGPTKLRIPIVVEDIINALKQKDMSVEGIFRLNGNIKKLRELTEEINKNPLKSPDFSTQTAVQLAALMKKWLRELPIPLLTFNLYDLWILSQSEKDLEIRKRILQLIYCLLPRDHRNLLEVLLYFFSWVASFSEVDEESGSKMDSHNLATVLAPNILISKQAASNSNSSMSGTSNINITSIESNGGGNGENYFLAIEVVNQLIEQHEELSTIPIDLLNIFENCGFDSEKDYSTKEILNKLENVYKENENDNLMK
ncbi:rga1 [Candida pseudojiufengensis]|uniref:rga1 n=1 Tax=Candida pseudojiufengensis TaxID=497109 RepID=UPI0022253A52|nr:rga1 [Candida pseudojiufengensis]KAI5963483.1 rga1 [Candida pseudojiufengensis]